MVAYKLKLIFPFLTCKSSRSVDNAKNLGINHWRSIFKFKYCVCREAHFFPMHYFCAGIYLTTRSAGRLEEVSLDVWLLKTTFIVQRLFIDPEKSVFRQKYRNTGEKRDIVGAFLSEGLNYINRSLVHLYTIPWCLDLVNQTVTCLCFGSIKLSERLLTALILSVG